MRLSHTILTLLLLAQMISGCAAPESRPSENHSSIARTVSAEQRSPLAREILADQVEVRVRHVLVRTFDEAMFLRRNLLAGQPFDTAARQYSLDPSGKINGGDLGYFHYSEMVPEFSEAAFRLKVDEISEPVKTVFGWHLIRLEGVRPRQTANPALPERPKPQTPDRSEAVVAKSGSGIVVAPQRVLTNAHVVDECRSITVTVADALSSGQVLRQDLKNDLALIGLATPVGKPATFREGRPVRTGEEVVVAGFPLYGLLAPELNVTRGTVSALAGIGGDVRFFQITAPVQAGNSGGPLLDDAGNVAGVIVSKLDAVRVAQLLGDVPQNINFAIKGQVASAFLEAAGVQVATNAPARPVATAEIADRARKFSALIECR